MLPALASSAICCRLDGISPYFLWIWLNPTPYPQILPISSNKIIPEPTKSTSVLPVHLGRRVFLRVQLCGGGRSFRIDPPIREVVSGVPTPPSPGRASCALDLGVLLWTGRAFLM